MSTRYIMLVDENIDKMVMELLKKGIYRTKTEVIRNAIEFFYNSKKEQHATKH